MSGWPGGDPQVGDWVRSTRVLPVTFTDHLLGGDAGIARGSKGVVLARRGRRVTVAFDVGWGTQRATVSIRDCRVVRRGGGADRFFRISRYTTAARLGLALVLLFPVLQFVVQYLLINHSLNGITDELVLATVQGALDMAVDLLNHPVKSIVYLLVVGVMSRFAFGAR